ncbi:class I SAM-dependent methyltransferase [Metapseudomonas lalkuanensis]|uniref:class I SAM-dependent methyltransferase n=1 Tax=Metapseudomonas lalkuanensis TaxID=2604832 RepID=UPI001CF39B73|nr:class I SAM-dependent methyltransferase [Pseudomonas lalkuanensis]UCO95993.1 class I SAM-dependent methyltransferase [Pseudomonas lalkuanensis]
MPQPRPKPFELDSSGDHDRAYAELPSPSRREHLARRLADWREDFMARQAMRIAGEPNLVLDLPCGSGRFWPTLTRHPNRLVLAADEPAPPLARPHSSRRVEIAERICALHTPTFAIDLGENAVDAIFCMRFLHRLDGADRRMEVLREFHRVTRDTLIVSLWVDGNYQAWRRKRMERRRNPDGLGGRRPGRFVVPRAEIESEFHSVGFDILSHLDLLPGFAMWRVYVLRKAS